MTLCLCVCLAVILADHMMCVFCLRSCQRWQHLLSSDFFLCQLRPLEHVVSPSVPHRKRGLGHLCLGWLCLNQHSSSWQSKGNTHTCPHTQTHKQDTHIQYNHTYWHTDTNTHTQIQTDRQTLTHTYTHTHTHTGKCCLLTLYGGRSPHTHSLSTIVFHVEMGCKDSSWSPDKLSQFYLMSRIDGMLQ